MRSQIKSLIILVLGLMPLCTTAAEDGVTIAYQEPLQQLRLGPAPATIANQKPGNQKLAATDIRSMSFDAFGRRFEINLEENRSLLSKQQRERFG
ncbi:MAG: hypothetical protein WBM76_00600, partial [Woeseiaceae bacterium]